MMFETECLTDWQAAKESGRKNKRFSIFTKAIKLFPSDNMCREGRASIIFQGGIGEVSNSFVQAFPHTLWSKLCGDLLRERQLPLCRRNDDCWSKESTCHYSRILSLQHDVKSSLDKHVWGPVRPGGLQVSPSFTSVSSIKRPTTTTTTTSLLIRSQAVLR